MTTFVVPFASTRTLPWL